jgi:acetolactate synthase-1/2/3 large subunit
MHLAESASNRLTLIPVVHEVVAVMAAEAFNATSSNGEKAFALVTAGPGLTNCITGIAGAYLEAREVLVVGGQVKTEDLSDGTIRQLGIQEIDGVKLVSSVCIKSERMDSAWSSLEIEEFLHLGSYTRPGPSFLEVPIDIQGSTVTTVEPSSKQTALQEVVVTRPNKEIGEVENLLKESNRPVLLIGGGVSFDVARSLQTKLSSSGIPVMTTWNGADRVDNFADNYMGRPNTWGQRYANILIQQSDLVIAIGTRLGLQQTGFNWKQFAPAAKIVQIEIDEGELNKARPKKELAILWDANLALDEILEAASKISNVTWNSWLEFCQKVKNLLPISEDVNNRFDGFWNPYDFFSLISSKLRDGDRLIPSSSGSSFTVGYQASTIKMGVRMLSSKSLASMGHGLGMALGVALTSSGTTVLVEGDGGFAQNLQDLGTLSKIGKPVKIFIWDNDGYGSIRTTQKTYFEGHYVGCDTKTGLNLPHWEDIAKAFDVPISTLEVNQDVSEILQRNGTEIFIVKIHPDQTFFPKISSRVLPDGSMESNPLHLMSPPLEQGTFEKVWVDHSSGD